MSCPGVSFVNKFAYTCGSLQVPRSVLAQSISGGAEGKQFYLDSVSKDWHRLAQSVSYFFEHVFSNTITKVSFMGDSKGEERF